MVQRRARWRAGGHVKVAYFAESPADQAALTILTEAILGRKTESVKRQLYGSSHPSLSIEAEAMKNAAERLSRDLAILGRLFPGGFGALAKDLRAWLRND